MASLLRKMTRKLGASAGLSEVEKFGGDRQAFNKFYATHCWNCRRPLPPTEAAAHLEIWQGDPNTGFVMQCSLCKGKSLKC